MSKALKRPAPVSIRFSPAERILLEERSQGVGLSTYIKWILFESTPGEPIDSALAKANRQLLSHLLATLGASRIAPNLDALALEAFEGNVVLDRETIRRLREAIEDIRLVRNALMRALGLPEGPPSLHERRLTEAFNRLNIQRSAQ